MGSFHLASISGKRALNPGGSDGATNAITAGGNSYSSSSPYSRRRLYCQWHQRTNRSIERQRKEPYEEYSPQGSERVTRGLCDRMLLATARGTS